jgi:hypothetical protein
VPGGSARAAQCLPPVLVAGMRSGCLNSDRWDQQRRRVGAQRDEVTSPPVVRVRHDGVIDGHGSNVRVYALAGLSREVVAGWTAAASLQAATLRTVSAGRAWLPELGTARPAAARITAHARTRWPQAAQPRRASVIDGW